MAERPLELQRFLTLLHQAMVHQLMLYEPNVDDEHQAFIERLFADLNRISPAAPVQTTALPVRHQLRDAFSNAGRVDGRVGKVAAALSELTPRLRWRRRAGDANAPPNFQDRHGNATIVGLGGLEPREDVSVGVSLLAPDTRYPDHQHLPEEMYLVLSDGQWRQTGRSWHTPGPGGLVHNPPNIVHAMRSTPTEPLLAVWCLRHLPAPS
jgi:quercetin dioxygenase-like cupin family protein